jgi:CheY-like chemotaxis protein
MATILVVDDVGTDRDLASRLLQARGHTVLAVETGEAGWAQLQTQLPDLVLVDIALPGMTGLEFVERLRAEARFAPLRIIFYTAWYDEPQLQPILRVYGYPVLPKPFARQAFVACIEERLQG